MNLQATNIYDSLQVTPLLTSQRTLCDLIASVNKSLVSNPCCATVQSAVNFLQKYRTAIYNVFGACAWAYACSPQQPPLHWGTCVERVEAALQGVLTERDYMGAPCRESVGKNSAWDVALDVWSKFYLSITSGCCARLPDGNLGARYVIRQTPNKSPYFGRTICMPTLTPARRTERSYGTNGECELALSQLPPQVGAVPVLNQVYCNNFGCYEQPQWGRAPAYNLECAGGSDGCCGPSLQVGSIAGTPPRY
jgi:hypothetical protein